jgi:hypothetical protein
MLEFAERYSKEIGGWYWMQCRSPLYERRAELAPGPPRSDSSCVDNSELFFADDYFRAVLTLLKVAFRLVPRPWTTAMIATEMPAAISPYSIAVAPDSSRAKR